MTPEQQRIAIAEACGWKPDKRGLGWLSPHGYYAPEPDYLNDLNAMHDAVMAQSGDFRLRYRNILADICGAQHYHNATAAQRAEAFLKTLDLWEETK